MDDLLHNKRPNKPSKTQFLPKTRSKSSHLVPYLTLFLTLIPSTTYADVYNGYNAANTFQHRQGNENSPIVLPNYYHSPNDKENRPHEFWSENEPRPHFHGGRPIDFKLHQHFGPEEGDFPENNQYITDPPGVGLNKNRRPCPNRQLPSSYDGITALDDGVEVRIGDPYDCDYPKYQIQVTPSPQKFEYDARNNRPSPFPGPDDLPFTSRPFPQPEFVVPNENTVFHDEKASAFSAVPDTNWPLDTNSNYDYDSNNLMAKPIDGKSENRPVDCYDNPNCGEISTPKPTIQDVITRKTKIPLRISTTGEFLTHPSTLEFIRSHTTERPEIDRYNSDNSPGDPYGSNQPNSDHGGHHDTPNQSYQPEKPPSYGADHPEFDYTKIPGGHEPKTGYEPNSSHRVGPPGAIPPEENSSDGGYNGRKPIPVTVRPKIIHRYYNDGHTTRAGGTYYSEDRSYETPFTAPTDLYTGTTARQDYGEFVNTVTPGNGFGENSEIQPDLPPNQTYDGDGNSAEPIFTYTPNPPLDRNTVSGPIIESGYGFNGPEPSNYNEYPKKEVTDESYPGVGTPKPTPPTTTESRPPYVPPATVTPSYNPYDVTYNYKHSPHPPGQEPPYEAPRPVTPKPQSYETTYNYRTTTPYSSPSTTAYRYTTPLPSPTTTVDYEGRFKTVLPIRKKVYPPGQEPPYEENNGPKAGGGWGDGYDFEKDFRHPHPTPPPTPPRYIPPSTTPTPIVTPTQTAYPRTDFPTPARSLGYSSAYSQATVSSYEAFDSNEAPETILALSPTPFSVIPTTTVATPSYRVVTVTARAISSTPSTIASTKPTGTVGTTSSKTSTISTKPDVGLKSFVKTGLAGGHGPRIEKIEPQTTVYPKPPPTVYTTVSITIKPKKTFADNDENERVKENKAGGHGLVKECCACCADDPRPRPASTIAPRNDDNGYAVTPTGGGPAPVTTTKKYPKAPKPTDHKELNKCDCMFPPYGFPGASPWFAPGGGPFPWAGGSQGCGGPCQGNPQPCCGPTPPKPCCPSVPNCCQTPCCPKISLPCCPQQSLCCDQSNGCGQCRSRAALRVRSKRTLCTPCNGRKKRDVFDEIIQSRQKRLACQFCSRKKRDTCQTCSPFQQSLFSQMRTSMDNCSQCPTFAHRKKREAEIKEFYKTQKHSVDSEENIDNINKTRKHRQVYADNEQCDSTCCDYSKCQRNSNSFKGVLRSLQRTM